jgi:hypothetical protein
MMQSEIRVACVSRPRYDGVIIERLSCLAQIERGEKLVPGEKNKGREIKQFQLEASREID